jgi:DnaJ-class molecular chaperone
MAQMTSLYDVLQVDQSATLEEIKLAFKRRALQVHPDKGGSKEAFHLVYEALETLADPAARKKYDHGLATGKSGNLVQPQPDGQTGKKKTSEMWPLCSRRGTSKARKG